MHFNSVDLPDPFSPITPKTSPSLTVKVTSFKAVNSSNRVRPLAAMSCLIEFVFSRWTRKVLVRWSTSSARSAMGHISSAKLGESLLKIHAPTTNVPKAHTIRYIHRPMPGRRRSYITLWAAMMKLPVGL